MYVLVNTLSSFFILRYIGLDVKLVYTNRMIDDLFFMREIIFQPIFVQRHIPLNNFDV